MYNQQGRQNDKHSERQPNHQLKDQRITKSFGFKVQKYLSFIYIEQSLRSRTFFIPPAPQLTELILGCLETFFECPSDLQDQSSQPINEPQNFQTHMIGPQE